MNDSLIFPPNIKLSHAAYLRIYAMGCGTSGTSATYFAHAPLDPVDAVEVDDVPAVVDAPALAVDVPGNADEMALVQGWLLETSPGTWEATGRLWAVLFSWPSVW